MAVVSWERDATLEHLALYLMDGLNKMHPTAIAAVRSFDDIPSDPASYPCLILHRTEEEGEALQRCEATIKYMLISQVERQSRPGQFRWVGLAIAHLLRRYPYHEPQMKIVNLEDIRSRYRIGSLQNAVFPFLEIRFQFIDWNIDIE